MDNIDVLRNEAVKENFGTVKLYPHNKETYDKIVKRFNSNSYYSGCRTCIVQPTGSGKSYIFMKWIEDNKCDRFIYLSPSTEIFEQFKIEAFKVDSNMLNNVVFLTYSKLIKMSNEEIERLYADKIIIDEFHRTGAEEWGRALIKLLNYNKQAQVLGATATPIRYLDEGKDMINELFNGDIVNYMTLGEAVTRGILPKFDYVPVWYDAYEDNIIAKYQRGLENGTIEYNKDIEYKIERIKKNLQNAYGVAKVFKEHVISKSGKYIVFCRNIEHLRSLINVIPSWFELVNTNIKVYVSTTHNSDRDSQFYQFKNNNETDCIKLLLTIDRFNEGVHVKGIEGVVMLRPTVSPIIYLQQLGRALASGSKSPVIFDMVNNFKNINRIEDNIRVNVLEGEVRDAVRDYGERDNIDESVVFSIFEKVYSYLELLNELERTLYTSFEERWNEKYNLLKEYIDVNGSLPVGEIEYKGVKLRRWIAINKARYRNGTLPQNNIDLLMEIGVDVSANETEDNWNTCFNLLKEFIIEYGREPKVDEYYKGYSIGSWLKYQRQNSRRGLLSSGKVELLSGIVDSLNMYNVDVLWMKKYNSLKKYIKEYGCIPNGRIMYDGFDVGSWLLTQRRNYKSGLLSAERCELMLELIHDFDGTRDYNVLWLTKYELLKSFIDEYNRIPRSTEVYHDVRLYYWVKEQQRSYSKGKLKEDYVKLLNELSPDLLKPKVIDSWSIHYDIFIEYFREFNKLPDNREAYKGLNIGHWFANQKSNYKIGKLSDERIKLFTDEGIFFDIATNDEKWMENYDSLKRYVEENHILPPTNVIYEGKQIGKWLVFQKKMYSNGKLFDVRINLLKQLGIDLTVGLNDTMWLYKYNALKEYITEYSSLPVKGVKYKDIDLYTWLKYQNKLNREGKLDDNKKQLLTSINALK